MKNMPLAAQANQPLPHAVLHELANIHCLCTIITQILEMIMNDFEAVLDMNMNHEIKKVIISTIRLRR